MEKIVVKKELEEALKSSKGVLVGCSGGVDSVVLFKFLQLKMQEKAWPIPTLALLHVNYGLRGFESEKDEKFVESLGATEEVEVFVHRARENPAKKNIQLWARNIRYEHFRNYAKMGWIVALAHHLDDMAENLILRLARGSSPQSLLGMDTWSPPIWRPFLFISKASLVEWGEKRGVNYRHDASNDKTDYSRNAIRHLVLPQLEKLYPGAKKRMVRCALETRELSQNMAGKYAGIDVEIRKKSGGIDLKEWRTGSFFEIKQILSFSIGRPSRSGIKINSRLLDNVAGYILEHAYIRGPKSFHLPGGTEFLLIEKDRLFIRKMG